MKTRTRLWIVGVLWAVALSGPAATHYLVEPGTPGVTPENPYTNWETAATSVIEVIAAAGTNLDIPRIILVSNGVYVLTNTVTLSAAVSLKGFNGPEASIFDGNDLYRFELNAADGVLDSLTISNGAHRTDNKGGGGIRIVRGTVTNCIITHCTATNGGGGIVFDTTTSTYKGTVADSRVLHNAATGHGGGIFLNNYAGTVTIENTRIISNSCTSSGGGIRHAGNYKMVVRNCLIAENTANAYGGGIYIASTNIAIANCTIVSNYAKTRGGGIIFYAGTGYSNAVVNSIIVGNWGGSQVNIHSESAGNEKGVAYSCSTSNSYFVLDDRGNTTNSPAFVSLEGGDYHLLPDSPCINTGTNQDDWMAGASDLDGLPRTDAFSGRVDMGCYEYLHAGSLFRFR